MLPNSCLRLAVSLFHSLFWTDSPFCFLPSTQIWFGLQMNLLGVNLKIASFMPQFHSSRSDCNLCASWVRFCLCEFCFYLTFRLVKLRFKWKSCLVLSATREPETLAFISFWMVLDLWFDEWLDKKMNPLLTLCFHCHRFLQTTKFCVLLDIKEKTLKKLSKQYVCSRLSLFSICSHILTKLFVSIFVQGHDIRIQVAGVTCTVLWL